MGRGDWQATLIKVAAIVTATPRWVAALLAAEGLAIPADWHAWWLPVSACFSAAMAVVEGLAFAYVFAAWRNQRDKASNRLFWLAFATAAIFVIVLAPYIAASVEAVRLADILANRLSLLIWSGSVALSTIAIVVSVGYAQKEERRTETDPALAQAKAAIAELQLKLKEAEVGQGAAEDRARQAEERFAAAGDLFARLFAEEKRQRILAIAETWPGLPQASIAIMADAAQSTVSEVLRAGVEMEG